MYRSRLLYLMLLSAVALLSLPLLAQDEPYRKAETPVEQRVSDLLGRMSLDEKIGQMTLVEKNSIQPDAVKTFFIGGVLSGGGGYPSTNTPEAWAEMVNAYQDAALATPLGIPMIYGVDAVHGHNNVKGTTIFPHNIGLGATRNPDLVTKIAQATAQEMIATGIYWDYAPVIAVVQDVRWGRTYEAYGENTELVTQLGTAFLHGLQGDSLSEPNTVLGTPKHYIGDGGTTFGTSSFGPSNLDQGDTQVDEATLRERYLPPYIAAVKSGAKSIMVSYSSFNGVKMHGQKMLITDVLKGELGFDGFIVSDWGGIDQITPDYYQAIVTGINAGIDMNMVPYDYPKFIGTMNEAIKKGDISMERVDDAVSRILRVKFELGLFEQPHSDPSLLAQVGSAEHRALARQAVSESQVLLKNANQTLPIAKDTPTIFVAGAGADNIGLQSGGWTIEWQGASGDITPGTTILQGLQAAVSSDTKLLYDRFGRFDKEKDASGSPLIADVGIVVIGEMPYAEMKGDSATLALLPADKKMIARMRAQSKTLVILLLSGRPLIINDALLSADAFVASWLPGTEGAGIADVLFGDKPFTGKLSFTWPRSIEQIPFDLANVPTEGCNAPLFPYGYGLTADSTESKWLDLAAQCSAPVAVATAEPQVTDAAVPSAPPLAPEGKMGETYYAPFPVKITLDGHFDDWAGVPQVTLQNPSGDAGVSFGAAADADNLYFYAGVIDDNIISGQHETNYWNEDSVEFYINATGDLTLTSYVDGVAQINIPALNMGLPADQTIVSGVNGDKVDAKVSVVQTKTGYKIEASVPLKNNVWTITPKHDESIGFQVHLNGASTTDRDTKLIWSSFDTNDSSYQNPSVFGKLTFFEVGQPMPAANADKPDDNTVAVDNTVTWDSRTWSLVWADEFEGAAGTPVNDKFWGFDVGGRGWGNNQLEYDTNSTDNIALDGSGNLAITARKDNVDGLNCHYGPCQYTSGRILTQNKIAFTYGRVEARIKIPRGEGMWPAFWMLGSDLSTVGWPNSGEIDIMENVGKEPTIVHGTIHGPGYSGASGIGASYEASQPFADDFHVYAIDWDPNVIRWYVDGQLYNTLSANDVKGRKWVYDHDFFIILNLAVGGNWPGSPDAATVFPQSLLVDYVRVYELTK